MTDRERIEGTATMTEEKWRAIVANDASADGRFFYAVKTTGIFCRPSCKSKPPRPGNVVLFGKAEEALAARFRPCKRCKPTGRRLPDEEWISLVTEYIDRHYEESLTLDALAEMSHGSPYHLHRTFKKVKGVTPVEYVQRRRIERARELLAGTDRAVNEIGPAVGLPSLPYFITLFKKRTGLTPAAYRERHASRQSKEVSNYGESN